MSPRLQSQQAGVNATVAAVLMTVTVVLPVYLTGALGVTLQQDLGFDSAQLGLAVGTHFGVGAVLAPVMGRLIDRTGWRLAAQLSAVCTIFGLGAIATQVDSATGLIAALAVTGLGHALGMPAANLAIAAEVREGRRALAFGVKHMAIPLAGLASGASLPLVALRVGWRWAYAGALISPILSLALSVVLRGRSRAATPQPGVHASGAGVANVPLMLWLSLAGALASGAVSSLSTFFVDAAVDGGVTQARAGAMLALGSAVGLGVRPIAGWVADKRSSSGFRIAARMLALGSVGLAALAWPGDLMILVPATVVAFGAGWGWPGLYHYAVVQHNPGAAGAATGIVLTGLAAGGALGPMAFGLVADALSFPAAWAMTAGAVLVSATILTISAGRLALPQAPIRAAALRD